MSIIEAENLTKKFGNVVAVNHINLKIKEGIIFGFLGPNGAGKTTTINMLTTLLIPDEGDAYVAGYNVIKEPNKVRENIGIVFQESLLDNYLTAYENLLIHAELWGISRIEAKKRINELLELVELKDRANDYVIKYSGGMRRRLEIARGLLSEPKILFLDEPTLGLDPTTRRHIWDYILKVKDKGVTIFLTTHYMEEAQKLCDKVAIIDHGKIIAEDSPASLIDSLGGDVIEIKILNNPEKAYEIIKEKDFIKNAIIKGEILRMTVKNGEESIPKIMDLLYINNFKIESVSLNKPNLEDVFINLTGRKLREEGPESPWKRTIIMKRLRSGGI